jgi:hypothetical protein
MTQEEKAKAYDEALEQARKELKTCSSFDCDAAKRIIRVFPELKESEDEKTRKEIIDFFVRNVGLYPGIDRKEHRWLRWLEKLEDIKILKWRSVNECSDIPDGHVVVVAYGPGCFALDVVYGGKILHPTRGEIKATDVFYIPNTNENCGFIDKDNEQKEQKPSISCGHENDIEWSEEDERMVDIAEQCATNRDFTFSTIDEQLSFLSWLKYLSSRVLGIYWKPTKEQMRVLSKATPVNLMPEELSVYISLYEELKKLI